MRLLANENFPGEAVIELRRRGHDIIWIREDSPGNHDRHVLELAQKDNRILITFDKDFGELAFRFGLPASCRVILFRISMPNPEYVTHLAVAVLEQRDDWTGKFSVVEDDRLRMTPLP